MSTSELSLETLRNNQFFENLLGSLSEQVFILKSNAGRKFSIEGRFYVHMYLEILQNESKSLKKTGPEPDWNQNWTGTGPDQSRTGTRPEQDWNQNGTGTHSRNRTGPEPNQNRTGTGTGPEPDRTRTGLEPDQKQTGTGPELEPDLNP